MKISQPTPHYLQPATEPCGSMRGIRISVLEDNFCLGMFFWKVPSGQYGFFPARKEATDRLTEFGAAISASLLSAADAASFLSASALEV